jgi:branched-chain amino acid transport system ATP-binding protein
MTLLGEPLIEARKLCAGYGTSTVVRNLDLTVFPGEIVTLLGPNGAGKTTTVLTLSGDLRIKSGEVVFGGRPTRSPLHERARQGLALVTEERSLFPGLSVRDNLRVAGADVARVHALFPELMPLSDTRVGLLSGGEQQMLAVGRALGRYPRLLLADELSLGLAPRVVTRLLNVLREAATEQGVGILLVEQHVQQALRYSDRTYLMKRGEVAFEGTAADLLANPALLGTVYLAAGASSRSHVSKV